MKPEGIVLNLPRDVLIVNFCEGLEIPIFTCTKLLRIDIAIFSKTRKVIAPYTGIKVLVQARRKPLRDLLVDRDFIFELA